MKKIAILMSLVLGISVCSCTENSDNTPYKGMIESSDKETEPDENYDYGTLHYKNSNYDAAKKCFLVITSKDPNYEKAQEMIKKCDEKICERYIEKAEEYARNDEIDRAINEIELALDEFPDSEILMSKKNEFENKKKESIVSKAEAFETKEDYTNALIVYQQILELYPEDNRTKTKLDKLKEKILEQINKYTENQEYSNALTNYRVLLEAFPDDSALKSTYDKSYDSIIQEILEKSEEKNENDGYQSAIQYLKTMSSSVSDDRINEKIEYFYGFEPVYLTDLEPYAGYVVVDEELRDSLDNYYTHAICYETNVDSAYDGSEDSYAVYYVKSNYKKLSGTFAVPFEFRNSDGKIKVEIYADDIKVYTSEIINCDTKPFDFSIDISNVDFIKIMWICVEKSGYYSFETGYVDAQLGTIFDARLTKN